ncbi:MAG: hypothetical protein G01um101420_935 [Parcubacteria group bacterium Gr01-1014_20]|nr:MAG: hypothetical protein G01um101420_935 [Parcubacteria group bacterium Gr01-1014_20]
MQIKVRVVTNAKKERVLKVREHLSRESETTRDNSYQYKVYVSAPPEKGRANERLISLLSTYFKIRKNSISIISGLKSKEKIVEILS